MKYEIYKSLFSQETILVYDLISTFEIEDDTNIEVPRVPASKNN